MPSAPGEKLSAHSATPQLIGDSGQFEPEVAKDNAQVQGSIIHSGRAFLFIAPEMRCLDVVWVIIPPRSSHPFGISVCDLEHNFAVWQGYALNDVDHLDDCVLHFSFGDPAH